MIILVIRYTNPNYIYIHHNMDKTSYSLNQEMFLDSQPSHLRESMHPGNALFTVLKYIPRDHHHCQYKVHFIRTLKVMQTTKVWFVFLLAIGNLHQWNIWMFNFRQRNSFKIKIFRAMSLKSIGDLLFTMNWKS